MIPFPWSSSWIINTYMHTYVDTNIHFKTNLLFRKETKNLKRKLISRRRYQEDIKKISRRKRIYTREQNISKVKIQERTNNLGRRVGPPPICPSRLHKYMLDAPLGIWERNRSCEKVKTWQHRDATSSPLCHVSRGVLKKNGGPKKAKDGTQRSKHLGERASKQSER